MFIYVNMASKMLCKQLRAKAIEFLKSRKNANNLIDILSLIQDDDNIVQPCILTLEMIFMEILKRREMFGACAYSVEQDASAETKYRIWLRECYEDTFNRLLVVLEKHRSSSQSQALSTLMKLVALEGKHPLESTQKSEYYFPVQRLHSILLVLLSSEQNTAQLMGRFQEFTSYHDVRYFVWKLLPNIVLNHKHPSEVYIKNMLQLIDKIPLPKSGEGPLVLLCEPENGEAFCLNVDQMRKWLNRVWGCLMHWEHTPSTHHQLLVVLLERVLAYLDRPLMLTDYLMDSLDMGGPVSLLALQGIFVLIQKHNLDYPNIFTKLYSMFEPEIFHTRYKARLFYLSDLFLSSTHLPENLVAAFAKRLARLTLVAPPQDILVILMFIGNLILRHPGLKRLINHPTGGEVSQDPYIMEEREPMRSHAIESSLWEVQALQSHILPSIATAARFINSPLPQVEWDLSKILEQTPDDIFEKEVRKKAKEITLTFEKPHSMDLPRGERLNHYWNLS
ncbi:nucleolar complex protein 4 homolog B [Anabrus simplex]|uniref:nucleolar complex protein 4 homolog B n=1 Tax=Anabrus simplex TaxID=316456 RepID=UPI0034DD6B1A